MAGVGVKFHFPTRLLRGTCFCVLIFPNVAPSAPSPPAPELPLVPSSLPSPHSSAELSPSLLTLAALGALLHGTALPRLT